MPRNGSGVYSKAAGTTAVSNTTIESAKYNAAMDDLVEDLNAARPITAGGTGATSADGALTALGGGTFGISVFKSTAGSVGLKMLDTKAAVAADTALSYSGATAVTAGVLITTRQEGNVYVVAASSATDHHLTTAGGVKLYDRGPYASPAVAQTQQVMDRAAAGLSIDIMIIGDSLGVGSTRWPAKMAGLKDALNDYTVNLRAWTVGSGYGSPTTLATGTRGTCTLWNYSISGSTSNRVLGDDFIQALTPGTLSGRHPDLIIVNYGHNGGTELNTQLPMEAVCVGTVSRYLPFTPIIVLGQNKSLADDSMREKIRAFTHLVTASGAGFINVHAFFEDYGLDSATYYADDVHTTDIGSQVWAFVVTRAFVRQPDAMRSIGKSILNRGVIAAVEDYADLADVTSVSGITISRDTNSGYWQTDGGSMKLTGDGATTPANIYYEVLSSADIIPYRNRKVTFTVVMRVPTGSNVSLGRIELEDGVGTSPTTIVSDLGAGFVAASASLDVSGSATRLRAYIYTAVETAHSESCWIDRWNVVDGALPADPALFIDNSVTGQIPFPATQVPSSDPNTLDDYEEGSTTPTITAATGTFSSVSCALDYTKIGNRVIWNATVIITNAGTAAGEMLIPLPFTNAVVGACAGMSVTTFKAVSGRIPATSGVARVSLYDATTAIVTGVTITVGGNYRV